MTDIRGIFDYEGSWEHRRRAFCLLSHEENFLANLYSKDIFNRFYYGLKYSKRGLSQAVTTTLSDIGLFLTMPWNIPSIWFVIEGTSKVLRFDSTTLKVTAGLIDNSPQDSDGHIPDNAFKGLSEFLKEKSSSPPHPSITHIYPADALNSLPIMKEIVVPTIKRFNPWKFVYAGRFPELNDSEGRCHAFISYGEQRYLWRILCWHDIAWRRAFLLAWTLFPVLPVAEVLYQIVVHTPCFGTLVDRVLFHSAVKTACQIHLTRNLAQAVAEAATNKK